MCKFSVRHLVGGGHCAHCSCYANLVDARGVKEARSADLFFERSEVDRGEVGERSRRDQRRRSCLLMQR